MIDPKDPDEVITITFDFSALADSCSNPVVSCSVVSGIVDGAVDAMLSGQPQISGKKILQRLIGGVPGNTYRLRCRVDDGDGERWVVADTLKIEIM